VSTRGNPVPEGASFAVRQRAITAATGNTRCRQTYDLGTSPTVANIVDAILARLWFRKIAAMAWYRFELERPPQLPPVQDFLECHPNLNPQLSPEILVSVGHPSLRRAESQRARSPACCSCPSRAVNPLLRGGVAQLLRAIKASARCTHYSHDPAIYSQTWLFLLAVIRCYSAAPVAKRRGFPRHTSTPSLFFPVHISENSGSGSGGEPR
jgi:hypothetical protein